MFQETARLVDEDTIAATEQVAVTSSNDGNREGNGDSDGACFGEGVCEGRGARLGRFVRFCRRGGVSRVGDFVGVRRRRKSASVSVSVSGFRDVISERRIMCLRKRMSRERVGLRICFRPREGERSGG